MNKKLKIVVLSLFALTGAITVATKKLNPLMNLGVVESLTNGEPLETAGFPMSKTSSYTFESYTYIYGMPHNNCIPHTVNFSYDGSQYSFTFDSYPNMQVTCCNKSGKGYDLWCAAWSDDTSREKCVFYYSWKQEAMDDWGVWWQ